MHTEIAGSPMPNSVCLADRLRLHRETARPSIAATTVAAAGPNSSADVKRIPSDTEMVARIDGMRMLSGPFRSARPARTYHAGCGGCENRLHTAHTTGNIPMEPIDKT